MFFRFLTYLSIFVLISCKRGDQYPNTQIVAHAGAGLSYIGSPYHDNTLEAVKYSNSINQVYAVEVDIQPDKNGQLWLFHDDYLNDETNLTGCINQYETNELEQAEYKGIRKEKLTTLSSVYASLNSSLEEQKVLFLDIRHYNSCTKTVYNRAIIQDKINKLYNLYKVKNKVVILNTSDWIQAFYSDGNNVFLQLDDGSNWKKLGNLTNYCTGYCLSNTKVTKEEVDEIHAQNKQIVIFDIRSPKDVKNALKKHPDFIIVEDIKIALSEKYK